MKTRAHRFVALVLLPSLVLASLPLEAVASSGRIRSVPQGAVPLGTVKASTLKASQFHMPMGGSALGLSFEPGSLLNTELPGASVPELPAAAIETLSTKPGAQAAGVKPGATALGLDKAAVPVKNTPSAPLAKPGETIEGSGQFQDGARRIGRGFDQLKANFTNKGDPGVFAAESGSPLDSGAKDSAKDPASLDGASPSLAPPSAGDKALTESVPAPAPSNDGGGSGGANGPGEDDPGSSKWLGLGRVAVMLIGSLLVAQIGVEALSAAIGPLTQKVFGDFTVVAQLAIFASIAGIIGRQLAPVFIEKWGLRKTYISAQVLRLISISAMVGLLYTGAITLPLMMLFYTINGLIGGTEATTLNSVPSALYGKNQGKIEKFWTWEQTLLEIVGVGGPILTGVIVGMFGFTPALIAFPITYAVAIAIVWFTLKIPQRFEAMRLLDLEKKKTEGKTTGIGGVFKDFWKRIAKGATTVWKDKVLRTAFLAYTAFMTINPFLYAILAPAYALRLGVSEELATGVGGWLTGLYSLGGLLGGILMIFEQKRMAKLLGPEPAEKDPAHEAWKTKQDEMLRKSMLKWMVWGTVGLVALGTLAFPSPLFLGTLTIPALALIPFGIAQVISFLKIRSFFQARLPEDGAAGGMAFFGAASAVVFTSGLFALKYLFKAFDGFTPFWYFGAAMIPLAIYYVYLTRRLAKVSAPDSTPEQK